MVRKNLMIHLFCSLLIAAFLVLSIFLAAARGAGEETRASGTGTSDTVGAADSEITPDPLHRLPSTPEEAHRRLEERSFSWPETPGGDFAAAGVQGAPNGVRVSIPHDTVEGFITHPGGNVQVDLLDSGNNPKLSKTVTSDGGGWFKADMSSGDIVNTDKVVVTDLTDSGTATIDCTLTANISFANDQVTGTAVAGNTIDVYIITPSTYYAHVPLAAAHAQTTAAGGAYTANIADPDLTTGDAALVFSTNAGGHTVMTAASGSGGGLVVYPQYNLVIGYYNPGTSLTVNINGGAQSRNVSTMKDGLFEAWFTDYDIKDGDNVACNMGAARSITVRDVTAKCDPSTNTVSGTGPANRAMRITMDPYGSGSGPVTYETASNASGAFSVNLGATFTATGSEVFNVCWYDDDGDAVVYEFQSYSWYLAEGYTAGEFDTWIVVQNPGGDDADVVLTFQLAGGGTAPALPLTVGAGRRASIWLDSLPGLSSAEVATKVTSTTGCWITAERAEYFNYNGKRGGHNSIGTMNPSTTWYLAEGYTGGDFDTWVVLQNPGTQAAVVTLSFQLAGGGTAAPVILTVGAGRRVSIPLDAQPGLSNAQVATKVTSVNGVPVVAERAMYFSYKGKAEGHCSIGVTDPDTEWYLAEGYTGGDFDTWVVVQNPGNTDATVTLSFQLAGGGTAAPVTLAVGAGRRSSIWLDSLPGLSSAEVATKVTSVNGVPVVAERAVYFNYKGISGGHASIGTSRPSTIWYLAEGYTGGDFDTWVVVQNPGNTDATVTLSFQLAGGGTAAPVTIAVGAGRRSSIWLDSLPGLSSAEVATKVTSVNGVPVVAERAVYFRYGRMMGGHGSIGIPGIMED